MVRRKSTSGRNTARPVPARSTVATPSPTVAARSYRAKAARRISSVEACMTRRALSICEVCSGVSATATLVRSSAAGAPNCPGVREAHRCRLFDLEPVATPFEHRGVRGQR